MDEVLSKAPRNGDVYTVDLELDLITKHLKAILTKYSLQPLGSYFLLKGIKYYLRETAIFCRDS